MLKVTDEEIIELANEYGESPRYLASVADEAEKDGEPLDLEDLRDFLEEIYNFEDEEEEDDEEDEEE